MWVLYFVVNRIRENFPLAPLTTLQIGGPARFFLEASSVEEVIEGLEFAYRKNIGVFVLGGGSNLLVSDDGVDTLVLRVTIPDISFHEHGNEKIEVSAGAGVDWDQLVEMCVSRRLAGVECMSGIPGLVGGTPIQNVGAYGQEVSDTIVSVDCLDRTSGRLVKLTNEECKFSYRSSIFNTEQKERFIVLGVLYALAVDGKPTVKYKDLAERFAQTDPALSDVRQAVLGIRRSKSMVIDPDDPNSRSAGSFFKNPVIDRSFLKTLETKFGRIPHFDLSGNDKLPAAWLIENSGFHKGFSLGNVGISQNHSLALINRGKGTAREIIRLKTIIQDAVFGRYGIE